MFMQYALLIYEDETLYGPGMKGPAIQEIVSRHMAFNRELGSLRWQNQTHDGGGSGDGIGGLKFVDDRLYVAGYADRADGGFDFTVRTYDPD
jgi:hypothetical protein